MEGPAIVIVDGITVAYQGLPVLEDISFTLTAGRFTGVIGPNGAGKTTLLKAMLGLIRYERGTIRVFGHPPGQSHNLIGYVPQFTRSDPNFPVTVRDVVMMGRYSLLGTGRWPGPEDREAVENSMKRVGIGHLAGKHFGSLSGGERQKGLIARAIAGEPKLLLLDEPTTGVDVTAQEDFYALLKELKTTLGMTVVLVSHDTGVITRHIDDLLCLNHRLLCHGPPGEVVKEGAIDKIYGSEMTLVSHHHHHGGEG